LDYRSSKASEQAGLFGNMNVFVSIDSARQKHRAKTERQKRK
jgi:hypothetical protein